AVGAEPAVQPEVRHAAGGAGDGRAGRHGGRYDPRHAGGGHRDGVLVRALHGRGTAGGDPPGPRPVPRSSPAVAPGGADRHAAGLVVGPQRRGIREALRHARGADGTGSSGGVVMATVALALLWHQHQPYYPDDVAGDNPMPWVRLHGVKDYYGMALHLLEFPEIPCTINLLPSLLVQLQAYADRGATDRFLQASRVPADALSEADCLFLLDHFFMANPEHMIRPHPRYFELYQRRAPGRSAAREVLRRFSERD